MKLDAAREIVQAIIDDDPTGAAAPALTAVLAELDRRGDEIRHRREAEVHLRTRIPELHEDLMKARRALVVAREQVKRGDAGV